MMYSFLTASRYFILHLFSFMRLFVISFATSFVHIPDEFFQVLFLARTHVSRTVDRCISFGIKGRKGRQGIQPVPVVLDGL